MKTKQEKKIKISFPLGLYFQQLFDPDIYVKFINPFKFWRGYRINHLETCWEFNTVKYLERCGQREWQLTGSRRDPLGGAPTAEVKHNKPIKNFIQVSTYWSVPWAKTPQNKILIFQPSMKIKYRGVTHHTSGIVAVNINKVETHTSQASLDGSEKLSTGSNNSNISQTSSNI